MADPARVLEEALTLEPTERAKLVHVLIGSLDPPDGDAQRIWAEEIRRRIEEIDSGAAELEDWEVVRERLQAAARR